MPPFKNMPHDAPRSAFLPYGRQTIEQDDIDAVAEVLRSDYLTTGPKAGEFEQALARAVGAGEAVVVGNGTQALHLACIAAGLGPGDCAVVPGVTFLATANAVRYCGADVLFCDVDAQTGLLDTRHFQDVLERHGDKSIKAVLPVHMAGQAADLPAIRDIADRRGVKVIGDAAHALGSQAWGTRVGSGRYEDMSIFSFHPVKTITMGEGGAITLNDPEMAARLRRLRSHGMRHLPERGMWFYEMAELGFNYRATDMQCALGLSQIGKLERFMEKRRGLAALYNTLLKDAGPGLLPPVALPAQSPAWHLYAVRLDFNSLGLSRNDVMQALKERGISSQVHYIPVHAQPYYETLYGRQDLPGAEDYYRKTLSLPLYPAMDEEDVRYVACSLREVCGL